ncbi:MAG: carboxylate-amine ligase, partial [Bacteroidota bacterium]
VPDLAEELLAFVDDVVDELGSRQEIAYIREIIRNGTGADRQLEVYKQTGDFKKVVDHIIEETNKGI